MPAYDPCIEIAIEVRSVDFGRTGAVELIATPGGDGRRLSSLAHRIQWTEYFGARVSLSQPCQSTAVS